MSHSLIPPLGKLRQDGHNFEVSQGCMYILPAVKAQRSLKFREAGSGKEAPRRQRLLWNVSRLAVRQAVYTAVHKTLAGRRLSPDLPRSPLQGRDHPHLRPISYRLRAASPGPGAGPLGERTHRLPWPRHWGQCLNRVKGLPSAWPSSSRGRG